VSAQLYSAKRVSGATPTTEDIYVFDTNNQGLITNWIYPVLRYFSLGSLNHPLYYVAVFPAPPLVPGSTLVSGGTTNGVLYSDGTHMQSASGLLISGGAASMKTGTGDWLALDDGSH
jgi:hypothetical protein